MALSGQLSNHGPEVAKWLSRAKPQVRHTAAKRCPSRERQKQVRLSGQQQRELVERYRAGATQQQLADLYGIERRTAMEIVRRYGAQLTRGLSPAQIDEAVERYERGESLAAIGTALGFAANTVRKKLLQRRVPMRAAAGGSV